MKLRIERETFLRGLAKVLGVVERKSTMPILSNTLLDAKDDGTIELTGTNLDVGAVGSYQATVKEPGRVTLEARRLHDIVRELDADEETFPPVEARRLMRLLRNRCWYGLVERAGDAFVRTGVQEPAVRRQYAQALLDQGRLAAGQALLLPLLEETKHDKREQAEVRGLLGRAHKQMYIEADSPDVERNRRNLETAARIGPEPGFADALVRGL